MDMEKVNSMDFGEFVDVFGNVIERCPLIAAAVWSQRPFSDLEDLEKHFSAFIDALPQSGQEGILRCHPDLAGRELQRGTFKCGRKRHSHSGAHTEPAQGRRALVSVCGAGDALCGDSGKGRARRWAGPGKAADQKRGESRGVSKLDGP
ncbi:PREDICTED: putative 2-oxo-4-hydroxy-4-carboxy-5-ureidoimidazoline decarboxylase [Miniopterus natalensis]|uniref:putative 2-oxo-4-hydroxy-4-carboxy-5-ureidoimidazoline decarboxylase n=1 Tax=Miniopterus natalensis TaxID=291302 RepID=UPI0007A70FA7|nr:PREDICTED: putative 2-oxo-4-hydroxy-4-carboxy-5-ureidoimidazoline decarboxylase [Miniopterus natalensis]